MNLRQLIQETEACVRDEIAAQERYAELIRNQLEAARTNDTEALIESAETFDRELSGNVERERRRRRLLAGFSRFWSIDPSVITLGSIAERLGPHGEGLDSLRLVLRSKTAEVLQLGRSLSAVARQHHALMEDLFRVIAGEGPGVEDGRGTLVNAEA